MGYGEKFLESLPGNCGRLDVDDVMLTLKTVKKLLPKNCKTGIFGESHGGFLTLHSIGQYPEEFDVAVAKNPVADMIGQFATTDIPDWSCVEGGIPFKFVSYFPSTSKTCLKTSPCVQKSVYFWTIF